jgi:hypothetical protein
MRIRLISVSLLCLGWMLACGGGGGTSHSAPPTGSLTLRFGSDSIPGYGQVWVSVEKVEGSFDGNTWTTLGNVKSSYDLMTLQNGHSVVILPATAVTPGTYAKFRLTWASVNYQSAGHQPAYLVLPNTTELLMNMPTTKTTVVKGSVAVAANGSTVAQLMLSGQQAVQTRPGTVYTFQATGTAYDVTTSAKITGHLGDGTTDLNNVEVFAETVDGLDLATVQRRALTDSLGDYTLEGLPAGAGVTYYVVAQPASASAAYDAKGQKVITATPVSYPADFAFSGPKVPGALTLTVTPGSTATQVTWGELRQTLITATAESHNLIVQSQPAATSIGQDQVYFTSLSPNSYGVTSQRTTNGGAPVMKVSASSPTVSSNTNIPANLSYP